MRSIFEISIFFREKLQQYHYATILATHSNREMEFSLLLSLDPLPSFIPFSPLRVWLRNTPMEIAFLARRFVPSYRDQIYSQPRIYLNPPFVFIVLLLRGSSTLPSELWRRVIKEDKGGRGVIRRGATSVKLDCETIVDYLIAFCFSFHEKWLGVTASEEFVSGGTIKLNRNDKSRKWYFVYTDPVNSIRES